MFLWWCGGVFVVVVFLRWCFCGGVVVFLWRCGGVFVVVCGGAVVVGAGGVGAAVVAGGATVEPKVVVNIN